MISALSAVFVSVCYTAGFGLALWECQRFLLKALKKFFMFSPMRTLLLLSFYNVSKQRHDVIRMLPFSQPVMTNTMQHLVSHLTFASTNQGHPFNPLTQLVTLSLSFLNYKNFPNHHFFDTIHLFKNNRDMFTWGLCLDCWVFCCLHNTAGFGLAQSCFRGEYSDYCLQNNLLKKKR